MIEVPVDPTKSCDRVQLDIAVLEMGDKLKRMFGDACRNNAPTQILQQTIEGVIKHGVKFEGFNVDEVTMRQEINLNTFGYDYTVDIRFQPHNSGHHKPLRTRIFFGND
jgi:hypothetical protein